MTTFWNLRYRVASYIRSSLWIIPIVAVLLQQILGRLLQALDARLGLTFYGLGVEGAKAVFNAVITFSLSFIVFTFGSLLIAIQVSSGQYTPRIIATTLLRNNVIRCTVGLFVFTFLFAIRGLNQTETTVHQLVVFVTGILGLVCLAAFLYLIDYSARFLRPISLMANVGEQGLVVIDTVYPETLRGEPKHALLGIDPGPVERTILHRGTSAIVVAINTKRLTAEAGKAHGVVEFVPQVGDFLGMEEPLFFLHGGAGRIDERILRGSVIFGTERTMEQDPLFAFRILVDIAIKALSPAINDPTTGVLAIDQLQRLLRRTGRRELRTDYVPGHDGTLPSHSSHTELGRFRPSYIYRNSLLRCLKYPDCPTITRGDYGFNQCATDRTPFGFTTRTQSPRSDDRKILQLSRRPGIGANPGLARAGCSRTSYCARKQLTNQENFD